MKVKNKLRVGFGFLFIVVLFFGAVSVFYMNQIANSAKVILKDNYESLSYCREMRSILDENSLPLSPAVTAKFNAQLVKEEHNITEHGEGETVAGLKATYLLLQSKPAGAEQQGLEKKIRRYLLNIEMINMRAIVHKRYGTLVG
jgi:NtrC-family two-component system sensor histidine kinase KinB